MADFKRGDTVTYHPPHGGDGEEGIVTNVNERYVFVQFDGDSHSKACSSGMLMHVPWTE